MMIKFKSSIDNSKHSFIHHKFLGCKQTGKIDVKRFTESVKKEIRKRFGL